MIAVVGSVKEVIRISVGGRPDEAQADMPEYGDAAGGAVESDRMTAECGGCGFNIAVNLARMGHETELISAVGDDIMGDAVKVSLQKSGVGITGVGTFPDMTAISVEFLNVLGDLEFAKKNVEIINRITPEFLKEREHILERADAIVIDGSVSKDCVEYIAEEYGKNNDIPLFFDPASINGGGKVKGVLERFHCVMPGRMEAEAMTGKTVLSEEQLIEAGAFFEERGVDKTIITIKGGGLYYREASEGDIREGILRPERKLAFANTAGAGDVVSAAVVASIVNGQNIEEAAGLAMRSAAEFLADIKDEKFM